MLSEGQKRRLRLIIVDLREADYPDDMISRLIHWEVANDPGFRNPHPASATVVNEFLKGEGLPPLN